MRPMLLWESLLTFLTIVSASMGLANIVPSKVVALLVIIVQGLNGATVVYKTGQWNPVPSAGTPAQVIVVPSQPAQGESNKT